MSTGFLPSPYALKPLVAALMMGTAAWHGQALAAPIGPKAVFSSTVPTQVVGVDGVQINGAGYDVDFVFGSCDSVLAGCQTFDFSSQANTNAAILALGQALAGLNVNLSSIFPLAPNNSQVAPSLFTPFAKASGGGNAASTFFAYGTALTKSSNGASSLSGQLEKTSSVGSPGGNLAAFVARADEGFSAKYLAYARFTPEAQIQAVPEPDSAAMLALGVGAAGLAMGRRRRRPAHSDNTTV